MLALITGGTGYVAGYLARRLLADGFAVRLTRRTPHAAVGQSPAVGAGTAELQWVDVPDIGPDTDWREALEDVNVVFHLAGVAHRLSASQSSLEDEYDRVNALGTERLARCLVERGGRARIVLMSSIGAVCTTSKVVVGASTPPRPDSAYGRSKLRAETLLADACAGTAVEWCALRAPLVYGPDAPGNMGRLLRLAGRGVPLPLGRAHARRSFVFVGNLVDALVISACLPEVSARILVVSDGESTSVAEVLKLAGQIQGRRVCLLPVPLPVLRVAARLLDGLRRGPADRNDRLARSLELLFGSLELDTSEFRALVRWHPPYSLREGMKMTLATAERKA